MKYRTFALFIIALSVTIAFVGVWGIYTSAQPTENTQEEFNLETVVINKDSPYTFNFNYNNSRVEINETQDLSIFLNSTSNELFRGAEITLTYDPTKLEIESIEGSTGSFDVYADPTDKDGTIKIAGVTTEDKVLNFGVEIVRLKFTKIASGTAEIKVVGGDEGSKVVNDQFQTFASNETILTVSD